MIPRIMACAALAFVGLPIAWFASRAGRRDERA